MGGWGGGVGGREAAVGRGGQGGRGLGREVGGGGGVERGGGGVGCRLWLMLSLLLWPRIGCMSACSVLGRVW